MWTWKKTKRAARLLTFMLHGWAQEKVQALLERRNLNRILAPKLNIRIQDYQRIRLPNSLSEPARLIGDPDIGTNLSMPIGDADFLMDQLDLICRGQKASALVRLGDHDVLLERRDRCIAMKHNSWLPSFSNSFKPENVEQAVATYKKLRKNYGDDGRYPIG